MLQTHAMVISSHIHPRVNHGLQYMQRWSIELNNPQEDRSSGPRFRMSQLSSTRMIGSWQVTSTKSAPRLTVMVIDTSTNKVCWTTAQNLTKLDALGGFYTCANGFGMHHTRVKLDRAFGNQRWVDKWPAIKPNLINGNTSNHFALVITLVQSERGNTPFCFFNS